MRGGGAPPLQAFSKYSTKLSITTTKATSAKAVTTTATILMATAAGNKQ